MDNVKYNKIETSKYDIIFEGQCIGTTEKCESASRSYWSAEINNKFYSSSRESEWGNGKNDTSRENAVYYALEKSGYIKE